MSQILDKMAENFASVAEWKVYCHSLQQTILKLSKEVNNLQEKNKHLEDLVKQAVPIIETEEQKKVKQSIVDVSDEEAIAIMELAKLKEISLRQDLDMSQTKQVEIYTKILLSIRETKKKSGVDASKGLSDEKIIDLLSGNGK